MEIVQGPVTIEDGVVKMVHHGVANQHGSSGGGWVANWSTNADEDEKNYVVSLESHGRGEDGVTYGPYFDDRFKNLLDYVDNGLPVGVLITPLSGTMSVPEGRA
ncbi:MAG: hypothetical protein WDN31_12095 [Hyphomicrobium sp.]